MIAVGLSDRAIGATQLELELLVALVRRQHPAGAAEERVVRRRRLGVEARARRASRARARASVACQRRTVGGRAEPDVLAHAERSACAPDRPRLVPEAVRRRRRSMRPPAGSAPRRRRRVDAGSRRPGSSTTSVIVWLADQSSPASPRCASSSACAALVAAEAEDRCRRGAGTTSGSRCARSCCAAGPAGSGRSSAPSRRELARRRARRSAAGCPRTRAPRPYTPGTPVAEQQAASTQRSARSSSRSTCQALTSAALWTSSSAALVAWMRSLAIISAADSASRRWRPTLNGVSFL